MESILIGLLVFVVLGVAAYIVNKYVPMPDPMKLVFNVVIAILCIWWLLAMFGVVHAPFPRVK